MSRHASAVPLALGLAAAGPLAAQESDRPCLLQLEHARQANYVRVVGEQENAFFGGDVRFRCRGQNVRMWTDSLASYQDGQIVYFIGHFRYEDETSHVTSDFGTYYKINERWEARGNVAYADRQDGSTLRGPSADYFRRIRGVREEREIYADRRPTLTVAVRDSARQAQEPYTVVADRIRLRGDHDMWGGGRVTIDRSDLEGRSDSLLLDSRDRGAGALIGHASIFRIAEDSFRLSGRRIDLTLERKELTYVVGRDSAALTGRDLDLDAGTIAIDLEAKKVVQTLAWGADSARPVARADEYEVRSDSLAVDTPGERIRELRAFGRAWVGFRPDTAQGERDWLQGDRIVGEFADSGAGSSKAALRRLEANGSAKSFYRATPGSAPDGRPSINYSRADRIQLFLTGTDSLKVERVEMHGKVDGVQLEPTAVRPDTARRDTTRVRRPR